MCRTALQNTETPFASKNDDVSFDFAKQPILTDIVAADDGQHWLKARGTTLGADDGIGAAAWYGIALTPIPSVTSSLLALTVSLSSTKTRWPLGFRLLSYSLLPMRRPRWAAQRTFQRLSYNPKSVNVSHLSQCAHPHPVLWQIMINVDSEDENEICIGCAGGFE